jgi:hypothetical protein
MARTNLDPRDGEAASSSKPGPRTDSSGTSLNADSDRLRFSSHRWKQSSAVVAALWILALLVTAELVRQRYRGAVTGGIGADFRIYLHAARLLSEGHSPYQSNGAFVYPPTLALLLSPFIHAAPTHVFRVWTILELAALLVGIGAFVAIEAAHLRAWLHPILFVFCAITVLHFWPLTVGLYLGQADAFVFCALMLSALAASRELPATRGALIGVSGLLKTWPAAVVVSITQKGTERRMRSFIAFVISLLVAPVLAVVFGGGSGLVDFVKSVISARTQHLVSDSVWGAPTLLFSNSGLAHPIMVSQLLRVIATGFLLLWVVGLLVVTVRTPVNKVICTFNVMFCVVLLLPVSHLAYALYCLPALWWWASTVLQSQRLSWKHFLVPVVLLLWWIVQTKAWPDSGSSPAISSLRYCVVFTSDLVACTASVIGAWVIQRPRQIQTQASCSIHTVVPTA